MVNMLKVIIATIAVFGLATLAMAQTEVTTDSIASGGAAVDEDNGWNSLSVDSSGNIFTVGTTLLASGTESHIMIAEFSYTGALVAGFGTGGIVILPSLSATKLDQGNGIAVDGSDNVYIVGTADAGSANATHADIVVAMFGKTGAGVAGFANAGFHGQGNGVSPGIVSLDSQDITGNANVGASDFGFGIALTTAGKIVVVGQSNGPHAAGGATSALSDMVVFQLTTAGALDAANFNAGGAAGFDSAAGTLFVNANHKAATTETATDKGMDVVIDSSGNIYALDSSSVDGISVFKITSTGVLQTDATGGFGNTDWDNDLDGISTEGVARYSGLSPAIGARIALDASGNIDVVGTDNKKLLIVRFTSKGIVDTTFNSLGFVSAATPSGYDTTEGSGISIQTGGYIFVSGGAFNGSNMHFFVQEYTSAGALVSGFASGGTSIFASPATADEGSITVIGGVVTATANPLVNTRTGIATYNTSSGSAYYAFAVGGVDAQKVTQADGLLLLYTLGYTLTGTTGDPASVAAAALEATAGSGGSCGALGLDALIFLGVVYLLKRKKAVIGGLSMNSVFRKSIVVIMILCAQAIGICQDNDNQSQQKKIEELQEQMKDMQDELKELRKQLGEQKTKGKMHEGGDLQKQIDQLKKQMEQDKKEESNGATPLRVYWENKDASNKGLWFKSMNNNFSLRIGGYLQTDVHLFTMPGYGATANNTSTFLIRRIRPEFLGTIYKYFSYDLLADFANNSYTAVGSGAGATAAQIIEGWLNFKPSDMFQIKVGKIKIPISMENLINDKWTYPIEFSYVFRELDPDREVGTALWGNVWGGKAQYFLGVFNGTDTGTNDSLAGIGNLSNQNAKEFVGRLWAQPFKDDSGIWLKGLQFGLAGTYMEQNSADLSGTGFTTDSLNTKFFTFAGGTGSGTILGNGARTRLEPQFAYMVGPFSLEAEYNHMNENMQIAKPAFGPLNLYKFNAAYVTLSYFLTGEDALQSMYRKTVLKPFDMDKGQWGALELHTRWEGFYGGDTLVPNGIGTGSQDSRGILFGLNWYPVNDVRVGLDWSNSVFGNGVIVNGRTFNHESLILMRFQLEF